MADQNNSKDSTQETVEDSIQETTEDTLDQTVTAEDTVDDNSNENNDENSLENQLIKAQEEAAQNLDKSLRAAAELENMRRRAQKDVESAHKFAIEKFAREILDILDSVDLGIKASNEENATVETIREGMNLIQQQFNSTLEKLNIEVIDAMGTKFNPDYHEAMTTVPNPDLEPNTVMDIIQKGYTLNQRLLRPSRVIVSKN